MDSNKRNRKLENAKVRMKKKIKKRRK